MGKILKASNTGRFILLLGYLIMAITLISGYMAGDTYVVDLTKVLLLLSGAMIVFIGLIIIHRKTLGEFLHNLNKFFQNNKPAATPTWKIFQSKIYCYRKLIITAFILFLVFFTIYLINAKKLAETNVFNFYDLLFEIDPPRTINDMTVRVGGHYRTKVHPYFVLMINPVGVTIAKILRSQLKAVILLNSILGASGVLLGFTFFWIYTKQLLSSFLLASLFGISTSHVFLSSIPDTPTLAICSLLTTYIIFFIALREKRMPLIWWILAGLFSLGVTTTNFIQTLICFTIYLIATKDLKRIIINLAKFNVSVLIFAISIASVQKFLYPSSFLFFIRDAYYEDLQFLNTLIFSKPLDVIIPLIRSFLFDNIIAPIPKTILILNNQTIGVTFAKSWHYLPIGWLGLIIWVGLLFSGAIKIIKTKKNLWFFVGITLCILFNFGLHSFYGFTINVPNQMELFLYTGNVTFLVILLIVENIAKGGGAKKALVGTLVILMSINNLTVMAGIINFYDDYLGDGQETRIHLTNKSIVAETSITESFDGQQEQNNTMVSINTQEGKTQAHDHINISR